MVITSLKSYPRILTDWKREKESRQSYTNSCTYLRACAAASGNMITYAGKMWSRCIRIISTAYNLNCDTMLLSIKVIPNSKKAEVKNPGENNYVVKLNAPAEKGKANLRLIEVLSEYFGVPKSLIRIIKGHKTRNKIVEIASDK
jgi:hypothetical protein